MQRGFWPLDILSIDNFGILFGSSFEVQENIAIFAHNL
jgi:hypothetical protein